MAIDYEDAFGYPLRGDDVVTRFLVGGGVPVLVLLAYVVVGVLSMFLPPLLVLLAALVPVSFAVGLVLSGYYVRVVRATYDGDEDPPAFGDWTELFVDGGYCLLVGVVYALPLVLASGAAVAVFVAVVGGGALLGGSSAESAFAALGLLSVLGFALFSLLAMAYSLVVSYLYPISVCIYADTGGVRDAFSKRRLLSVAKSEAYAIPWLVQAGVLFAVQTVVGMLTMVLIGYLLYPLLPFASFFVSTAAFYMFARTYQNEAGSAGMGDVAGGEAGVREDSQPGSEAGY